MRKNKSIERKINIGDFVFAKAFGEVIGRESLSGGDGVIIRITDIHGNFSLLYVLEAHVEKI